MARPLRIEYEGAFYHITSGENWGQVLTLDRYFREIQDEKVG
jgi:hypothetical protein